MRTIHSIAIALLLFVPSALTAQERARLPQGPPGTVTLPVAEYDRLVDRANQPARTPEPPPVDAVVGRAELRARVAGDMVRGTLHIDGEVFQRGQVKVLLVSWATLLDARADGRPLPLLHEAATHAAILAGPAPFSIMLEWAAPVTSAPGRASFMLPTPAGSSAAVVLDLPGEPADVRIEPGLVTRRLSADGRTSIEATLEPGRQSRVSWSARETPVGQPQAESRVLSDVKSLVTIGEADLRMVALVDVTVVRGEPRTFELRLPAGFELVSVTGSSVESTEPRPGAIELTVREPAQRRHQFLVSLEQAHGPGSFKADASFPTLAGAQREVGETAVEGAGAIEVEATGDDGMRRMDVREVHAALRSLARQPLLAAFRYQRRPQEARVLTLDVRRFADAPVVPAAAERAVATTLVTAEGRTLTEVSLWIRNRAQAFMKVTLPAGATMLSADVAGETAKPVSGADGIRVPLMRPGFRPAGPYTVSFVYVHAGGAFAKRGNAQMSLPKLDVPVSVLEWELFLPDRFQVKPDGGNVIPARMIEAYAAHVSALAETVAVTAEAPVTAPRSSERGGTYRQPATPTPPPPARPIEEEPQQAPSQNVLNLQRRVAGVLPVRIDVPRSGTSYRFMRPLVLDEETTVSFRYKTR